MDAIELLRQQALDRRNKAIQKAKREYSLALHEIKALATKLRLSRRGRPRKAAYDDPIIGGDNSCYGQTVIRTIDTILGEGKALTLVELTIEVQRRGCRARDDSRLVAGVVRNTLTRYKDLYQRDEVGRWSVIS